MPKTTSIAERTRARSPGARFRGELKNSNAGSDYSRPNKEKEHNTLSLRSLVYDVMKTSPSDEHRAQRYAQIVANSEDVKGMVYRIATNGGLTYKEKKAMLLDVVRDNNPQLGYSILTLFMLIYVALSMLWVYFQYLRYSPSFSNLFNTQSFEATPEATDSSSSGYSIFTLLFIVINVALLILLVYEGYSRTSESFRTLFSRLFGM